MKLTLVSHHLCPYVQRAAIALAEKGIAFEREIIDLANKPDWFTALSPLGKVPLLIVDGEDGVRNVLFESAVIVEYLDEVLPRPLHPDDPLKKARHRGWMEFGSAILAGIARLYSAVDETALAAEAARLGAMFARIEDELGDGPFFAGAGFSLVDAVFGPVFRYFDLFDRIWAHGILADKPKLAAWRRALAARPSVAGAVGADYGDRLRRFVERRSSALGTRALQLQVA